MQTQPAPLFYRQDELATHPEHHDVSRSPLRQRWSTLVRNFQSMLMSVNDNGETQPAPQAVECVENDALDAGDKGLITQINDQDRAHMQSFPVHLKTQVMDKITSREPAEKVVYHGKNRYEKVMMNIHREGYGLIDIQPYETAFTSVWYRKSGALMGKNIDITMLMWEEGADGDTTTLMNWKI